MSAHQAGMRLFKASALSHPSGLNGPKTLRSTIQKNLSLLERPNAVTVFNAGSKLPTTSQVVEIPITIDRKSRAKDLRLEILVYVGNTMKTFNFKKRTTNGDHHRHRDSEVIDQLLLDYREIPIPMTAILKAADAFESLRNKFD